MKMEHIKGKLSKAIGVFREMFVDQLLGNMIEEHSVFKHYKDILYNPTTITIDEFFVKLNEVNSLERAMSYLRKMWFPQCGSGSQSEELSFNKALIQSMSEHIGDRDAQFEKNRIEDEKWEI